MLTLLIRKSDHIKSAVYQLDEWNQMEKRKKKEENIWKAALRRSAAASNHQTLKSRDISRLFINKLVKCLDSATVFILHLSNFAKQTPLSLT